MDKDMKRLLKKIEAQGGRWRQTKGSHIEVKCPDKTKCGNGSGIVIIAWSPSDHRSVPNSIAKLRRCGFSL